MSTLKSDSIQPTATGNSLVLKTGVGDVERMRIDTTGLVGIGTASPQGKLEVWNGSTYLNNGNIDGIYGDQIFFGAAPAGYGTTYLHKIKTSHSSSLANSLMTFSLDNAASTTVDVLTLKASGVVSVPGTLTVSGALTVGTATMAVPSGTAPIFGARALVVFDTDRLATSGTAETTFTNTGRYIRHSGNVASVTRIGAGLYTIAFTTAMPNADYVVICSVGNNINNISQQAALSAGVIGTATGVTQNNPPLNPYNKTTTGFTIHTGSTSSGARNDPIGNPVSVVVFA